MNKATHLISAEAPGLGRPQLPPEEHAEQEHSCPLPITLCTNSQEETALVYMLSQCLDG